MTDQELKTYITTKENEFTKLKKQWESFSNEVPQKLKSLIVSGMKPEVTRGESSDPRTISIGLNFHANMDGAKAYIEKVREDIPKKAEPIFLLAKELDNKINEVKDQDIEEKTLTSIINLFDNVVDYSQNLTITLLGENTIKVSADGGDDIQKGKWNETAIKSANESYASKHNIAVADVEKHKRYLNIKEQESQAKTSQDMAKVKSEYEKLGSYLDSKVLSENAQSQEEKLKEKEKREAQELLEKQNDQYIRSLELFKNASKKDDYKLVIASLNNQKTHSNSEELIKLCNAKIKEIEQEEEKERQYNEAKRMIESDDLKTYEKALDILRKIWSYKDAGELVEANAYRKSELLAKEEEKKKKLAEAWNKKREDALLAKGLASANWNGYFAYVNQDGSVTVDASSVRVYGKADSSRVVETAKRWKDIKAVAAVGKGGVVGLKWDGTCVYATTTTLEKEYVLSDVSSWRNIKYIDANEYYCLGLDGDGNCHATHYHVYSHQNHDNDHMMVASRWTNVKSICCSGLDSASCLKKDGSISTTDGYYIANSLKNVELVSQGSYNLVWYDSKGIQQQECTQYIEPLQIDPRNKKPIDIKTIEKRAFILYEDNVLKYGRNEIKNVIGINPNQMSILYITSDGYLHKNDKTYKLFDDFDLIRDHEKLLALQRQKEAEERERIEKQKAEYREKGLCQNCGGEFKKTLFGYKCTACGRKKDY